MLLRKGLLRAVRSRPFQWRFQSSVGTINAYTVSKPNEEIKRKSSLYSTVIASLSLGGLSAQCLPLICLTELVISDGLPKPDTLEALEYQGKLEEKLKKLAVYKSITSNSDNEAIRAWNYMDSNALGKTITNGTLSVPGGIAIKPILFFNKKTKESVAIIHVGERLTGYPFLVHGGILATILDEFLKRSSSFMFDIDPRLEYVPDKIKTKSIELQYKFPTLANNFIVVKTHISDGKVEGKVESIHGRLLVKGVGEFELRK